MHRTFLIGLVLVAWVPAAGNASMALQEKKASNLYVNESFEGQETDAKPKSPLLQRSDKVRVVDGDGKFGSGRVLHFDDQDQRQGGAMEYNIGTGPSTTMFIEFDIVNHAPKTNDSSSSLIFAVGPWGAGRELVLNAKSKRAFGFEIYQKKYLKLRVGAEPVTQVKYQEDVPLNVKIWVNDHDKHSFSYKRPDSKQAAMLNPDSVVVWVDNQLMDKLPASGCSMHRSVTQGNAVLGRAGFSSSSTKIADFLIDNLVITDPSVEMIPSTTPSVASASGSVKKVETTPDRIPGAETFEYRAGDQPMKLFVFKPNQWKPTDKRAALVYFFGGGWTRGTPEKSVSVATWAAENGMLGIAPDYRTNDRFQTSPLASVDDGRAAFAWVVDHADELGIDPKRIVVGGSSAGGHVALWTAIRQSPPGSDPQTAPKTKPAMLYLKSAVTDTSKETGYTPHRFGEHAKALSPIHQLDSDMPPMIVFHAAYDKLVHYRTAVAFHHKLESSGNHCDLVTIPMGGHVFTRDAPKWNQKMRTLLIQAMREQEILPSVMNPQD